MNDSIILLEDGLKKLIAIGKEHYVSGDLNDCSDFIQNHMGEYIFGFLSYDLKNQIESLSSNNAEQIGFPDLFFCVPEFIIEIDNKQHQYIKGDKNDRIEHLIEKFKCTGLNRDDGEGVSLNPSLTKAQYLDKIKKLQDHIQFGDIYEVTFCQEFYANETTIDPYEVYSNLIELTQAPFSCFVQHNDSFLLSGSPERFMRKEGNRILSQPIKGTARRGATKEEDEQNKSALINSSKEKAENVMIVDLVRNDLSRIAKRNSVKVDELFGVYSFRTVHQLISTISAELKEDVEFGEILKAMFPMGSMTGAPKISAMKLIEKHESFKRGLFSGSVGYITPEGDFDFNVIIRSILYNQEKSIVSCPVGGAITIQSIPEDEYEECLLKVEALKQALNSK